MKTRLVLFSGVLTVFLTSAWTAETTGTHGRETVSFNGNWRFIQADPPGAEAPYFDDTQWTTVSAPHTFNDSDTFDNWSTPGHRGEQIQWSGRTWYRKRFNAPPTWRRKKVFIEFEGVRQNAEVYINGIRLGSCKTGFTPFGFDLTPHLEIGTDNVIAVMVDNRFVQEPLDVEALAQLRSRGEAAVMGSIRTEPKASVARRQDDINESVPESLDDLEADQIPWNNPRWHPAHGGLYRNVHLYITDPLHISLPLYSFLKTVGPYAYATEMSRSSARITVEVPVQNERGRAEAVELAIQMFDSSGRTVWTERQSSTIKHGETHTFRTSGLVKGIDYWEPNEPRLYRVVCTIRTGGAVVDTSTIPLGIRQARWDMSRGLFLNGKRLKLRGWGQRTTNEWPGLGAALPDWLHRFTLQLVKDAGGNLVRWGHAAAGPAQIAACDELGIIVDQPGVDGEADTVRSAWQLRASAFRDVIIYFRNNPSILVWEGGNQKVSRAHGRELRALFDEYDPHGGRVYAHRRADPVTAEVMDVGIGTEGGREIASLPVFEGEYNREESPRRVWDHASPPNFGYPEAAGMLYQLTSEEYAVNQVSEYLRKLGDDPGHSGGANWIFTDTTSGGHVIAEVARTSGELDGVRLPKEAYHVVAVMFRAEPAVHIIGHWTYPLGTRKDVFVTSNGEVVVLRVNGKPHGGGERVNRYLFRFRDVAFEPGRITAVALIGGSVVAKQSKYTAGRPSALRLRVITAPGGFRADGSDVALIDVEAVDERGRRVPTVQQRVDFETDGPCEWRGGYNSGKAGSVNQRYIDLEAGINRVSIRSRLEPGDVTVRARSAGLKSASVTIVVTR